MAAVSEKSNAAPEQDNTKPMSGRVDAIDQGRIFGWAFDPAAPTKRLTIRVYVDGSAIAEAVADRNRPDLKRNGIGDGSHAFEIALPEAAASRAADLTVTALDARGTEQKLRVPRPDEQAAEALIAAPLAKVLDKLDVLMAAQRQLQVSQRSFQRTQNDEGGEGGTLRPGAAAEIGQRLNDLDVHLMRLDGVVAAMEKNLGALQKRSNGELKPLLLLLFVLAGFAAGAALSLFAGA
ncbi:hypothetical protein GOC91_17135 [Sinorhizobium medicae]|uniref:Putative membrane-anchored protein n=2 Tax=Sinorhizobium medicae TaxID=110321 RepID=A0A508X438_9HYPH|nr:membrane protein [Sinorhizobium medicae]ABR63504.1 putative membrane-anchored protein [Sinorhizobium medicae WSM419]MBO1941787.1 hypothetical protein [Sinorhizobium medicae]MDX0434229.1 hypothetical protein [Sinorhizobium medicae]MDX0456578.1 hypothetical protein [Sinorhizobium medicae]MDX0514139.1 hypothetical protein [Sinorhizobium medicae]